MKQIESRNNPIIKRALKAINNPGSEKLIVVEGYKLLGEALKSGARPEMLFVSNEENGLPRHLKALLCNPFSHSVTASLLCGAASVNTYVIC